MQIVAAEVSFINNQPIVLILFRIHLLEKTKGQFSCQKKRKNRKEIYKTIIIANRLNKKRNGF